MSDLLPALWEVALDECGCPLDNPECPNCRWFYGTFGTEQEEC